MASDKLLMLMNSIQTYPDFPKKVFRNGEALKILMELIAEHAKTLEGRIDAVVGLESRGFLLGPHVALSLNIPFIPVRKMGKLPGELAQVEYLLEYGSDIFEIQKCSLKPGESVLIVDDLLATGGSLAATCQLMEQLDVRVAECFVVMELLNLKGREKVKNYPVHSLVQY